MSETKSVDLGSFVSGNSYPRDLLLLYVSHARQNQPSVQFTAAVRRGLEHPLPIECEPDHELSWRLVGALAELGAFGEADYIEMRLLPTRAKREMVLAPHEHEHVIAGVYALLREAQESVRSIGQELITAHPRPATDLMELDRLELKRSSLQQLGLALCRLHQAAFSSSTNAEQFAPGPFAINAETGDLLRGLPNLDRQLNAQSERIYTAIERRTLGAAHEHPMRRLADHAIQLRLEWEEAIKAPVFLPLARARCNRTLKSLTAIVKDLSYQRGFCGDDSVKLDAINDEIDSCSGSFALVKPFADPSVVETLQAECKEAIGKAY